MRGAHIFQIISVWEGYKTLSKKQRIDATTENSHIMMFMHNIVFNQHENKLQSQMFWSSPDKA